MTVLPYKGTYEDHTNKYLEIILLCIFLGLILFSCSHMGATTENINDCVEGTGWSAARCEIEIAR